MFVGSVLVPEYASMCFFYQCKNPSKHCFGGVHIQYIVVIFIVSSERHECALMSTRVRSVFLAFLLGLNSSTDYDLSHLSHNASKDALKEAGLWTHECLMISCQNVAYGSTMSPPRLEQVLCIRVHIHIYLYMYVHVHLYIHTCTYISVCVYACMYACMYMYMNASIF